MGCAASHTTTSKQSYKFLVAGQSNSVSPRQGSQGAYYSKFGNTTINNYYEGNDKFYIPTPIEPVAGGISWLYVGEQYQKPIMFNVIGRGNTSTTDWITTHLDTMRAALLLQKYDAIIWVQGESNYGKSESDTYYELKHIIMEAKKIQNIPFIVGIDGLLNAKNADASIAARTRNAQLQLIFEGWAVLGPDIDDLRLKCETDPSGGEFSGNGLQCHGLAWYAVLKEYFP